MPNETLAIGVFTVTAHDADLLEPSVVVAVIVAVPAATPVTVPLVTVAMPLLDDAHNRFLLLAVVGLTVGVITDVFPIFTVRDVGLNATSVAKTADVEGTESKGARTSPLIEPNPVQLS